MSDNSSNTAPLPENVHKGNSDDRHQSISSEPLPEWDHAQQTWQWAWGLHWAGLGALFALLALYALWSLIKMLGNNKNRKKPLLALVTNSLLFIFGASRALFLFINPYESEQCFLLTECPVILTRIMFGIALPCITASFSLIHLAFLQLSKLKLYPEKLQNGRFLACVVAFPFALALFTELMISMYAHWKALNIVCQTFFIVLGFILSTSFIYSGRVILKSVHETRLSMLRLGSLSVRDRRPNVSKLVKITFITVFVGFASCALQLYSISAVYNFYSDEHEGAVPKPWPWLIFQSLYRVVELVAGCTMAYVSPRQVLQHRRRTRRNRVPPRSNPTHLSHVTTGGDSKTNSQQDIELTSLKVLGGIFILESSSIGNRTNERSERVSFPIRINE